MPIIAPIALELTSIKGPLVLIIRLRLGVLTIIDPS
jgi:hypothetical protein